MRVKKNLKSVLCATDFSEGSDKAVEFAAGLMLKQEDGVLYLLHVVKPILTSVNGTLGSGETFAGENDLILKEARVQLEKIAKEIREAGVADVEVSVKTGNPVSVILDAVIEHKVELVVMGNRKYGFRKGIILGSVSARVSANSPVSVLIVR